MAEWLSFQSILVLPLPFLLAETGSLYIAQTGLAITVFLPWPLEYWDHTPVPHTSENLWLSSLLTGINRDPSSSCKDAKISPVRQLGRHVANIVSLQLVFFLLYVENSLAKAIKVDYLCSYHTKTYNSNTKIAIYV